MNTQRINYKTRSHLLPNIAILVVAMTSVGMATMMIVIMIGAGAGVSLVALLGSMSLFMALVSGETDIALDDKGLYKHVKPFIATAFTKQQSDTYQAWASVQSFKTGRDFNRGEEYDYLEINFSNFETWQITDKSNPMAFMRFKDAFILAINAYNNRLQTIPPHKDATQVAPSNNVANITLGAKVTNEHIEPPRSINPLPKIKQRRAFYETVWAKVFFWVMLAFSVLIAYWILSNNVAINATNIFKIAFVIIPGLGYLYYRIYGSKKKESQ